MNELMTAEQLMAEVKDGDEIGWPDELRWLWTEHREQLLALMDNVLAEGFLSPVQIGNDGRLWDGHHRVAVAQALGIMLPVQRVPTAAVSEMTTDGTVGPDPASIAATSRETGQ